MQGGEYCRGEIMGYTERELQGIRAEIDRLSWEMDDLSFTYMMKKERRDELEMHKAAAEHYLKGRGKIQELLAGLRRYLDE